MTASTPENISAIEKLVLNGKHITYRQIQYELGISNDVIQFILHEILHLTKVCARWIPHLLKPEQKVARIDWCKKMKSKFKKGTSPLVSKVITGDETWIYHYDPESKEQSRQWTPIGEPPPQKVRKSQYSKKQMYAIFFDPKGIRAVVALESGKTVSSEWYTTSCLPELIQNVHKMRPEDGTRGLLLHHDNASSHKALKTRKFIEETGFEELSHPPYSPDLAPCDFWLFPRIKKKLKGRVFSSNDEVRSALSEALEDIRENEFAEAFDSWFCRMDKCIKAGGEYFEQL